MSFLYASYFTTIIVYCLFYFANSFYGELPWTYCANKTWSTENCTDSTMDYFVGSVPVTQEYFVTFLHSFSKRRFGRNFENCGQKLKLKKF